MFISIHSFTLQPIETFPSSDHAPSTDLLVVTDVVAQADEAGLELLGGKSPGPLLVEVVKGHTELVHLLLTNSFRISRQNLKES